MSKKELRLLVDDVSFHSPSGNTRAGGKFRLPTPEAGPLADPASPGEDLDQTLEQDDLAQQLPPPLPHFPPPLPLALPPMAVADQVQDC